MTRWHFSIQALRHHNALAWLQVPSSKTTPSMSLQDSALMLGHAALAIQRDDGAVGLEISNLGGAQIEHRPARRIVDRAAKQLGQARPGQSDLERPHP